MYVSKVGFVIVGPLVMMRVGLCLLSVQSRLYLSNLAPVWTGLLTLTPQLVTPRCLTGGLKVERYRLRFIRSCNKKVKIHWIAVVVQICLTPRSRRW